ncbi:MAG: Ethyl tert-butyl ether degradation EthD [Deltaproteobacteria bacterium]|nr:Ethyl tert-butyl ether degradation EthD [Deltaproteobacteria bacterium]
MLKVIALIKRRADLARAEFRQHYEEIHVPLALRHIDQFRKYVRNHVTAEVAGGPCGFDCLTELWYADHAALQRVLTYLQSPAAEPIRRDELTFMAKPENVFFPVKEHVVLERPGAAPGARSKVVVLAARPTDESADAFHNRYEAALPAWLDGLAEPLRCVHNTVQPSAAAAAPWDAITMLWYAAGSVVQPRHAPCGVGRGVIVGVGECETPLA